MADLSGLSDEALAVFAFAAYHQLASGQKMLSVVRKDGAGHRASAAAADELDGRGLVRGGGARDPSSPRPAKRRWRRVVAAIRSARKT